MISLFALNFQRRNSADIVHAQTATSHTNFKKEKSQSTTPLKNTVKLVILWNHVFKISNDHLEIILTCWFGAQETFLILNIKTIKMWRIYSHFDKYNA